jgi:subtilase family serine protease
MPLFRTLAGVIATATTLTSLTAAGMTGPASAATTPRTVSLAGSAAPFTSRLTPNGQVAAQTRLSVQVWLQPRTAAASRFATAASTPGSSLFGHYLRPSQYTSRFGPSQAGAARVESWLRAQGFTAVRADTQRSYVRATAPASVIEQAFRVRLRLYPATAQVSAGPYRLRANDRPVTIPASLASEVLGVTGLDNAVKPGPRTAPASRTSPSGASGAARCSEFYGQHVVRGLPPHFGRTSFPTPVCGYSARQLRTAYGASSAAAGRGQTIAFVEDGLVPAMSRTLRLWAAHEGLPAPSARTYAERTASGGKICASQSSVAEEQLDVEAAYAMAPGTHELVVGGNPCDVGDFGVQMFFDAETAILNGTGGHPLASVVSNSWEDSAEQGPDSDLRIEHAFLVRAAAEGVGMYFSSGDVSGLITPSNDPFVTAVGGTTLGLRRDGQRLFETGWSTGEYVIKGGRWHLLAMSDGAGGGPSTLWKQPSYQAGVVPAALASVPGDRGGPVRSVPDISADGDFLTGMAVGLLTAHGHGPATFGFQRIGGTSLAAPLVAGLVTAAQQGQAKPFGFLNPVLYRMAGTGALRDVLPQGGRTSPLYRAVYCLARDCFQTSLNVADDQNPKMLNYFGQVTLPGYDNITGLGTPAGQRFITVLRRLER